MVVLELLHTAGPAGPEVVVPPKCLDEHGTSRWARAGSPWPLRLAGAQSEDLGEILKGFEDLQKQQVLSRSTGRACTAGATHSWCYSPLHTIVFRGLLKRPWQALASPFE